MLPVIALVGRPNVGKSTLFNRLTLSRDALVADMPGVTRDRQYGEGKLGDCAYIVIDTGGITSKAQGIDAKMLAQSRAAIQEADYVLFLVDAREGLMPGDHMIAQELRERGKPTYLVVNKTDGLDEDIAIADFYSLGLGEPYAIAAEHGRGVTTLIQTISAAFPEPTDEEKALQGIKVAIIGKPNVGKSTLVNRMLGEERVIVYDQPGTTRDSIFLPLERRGKHYTLIDTAGVRRRTRIREVIEKFSVVKTLKAVEAANVVIFMVDARENVSEHDLHLLGFVLDAGKSLVIAVNKWDGLDMDQREAVKSEMARRLGFVDFAKTHYISALHGTGVGDLYEFVDAAYASATQEMSTSKLTDMLEAAQRNAPPPLVNNRRIKLRYAHTGGHNPPIIVIHGNQTEKVPGHYTRYLSNYFRTELKLVGTPLKIVFKTSENPFEGRKNKLTPGQERKRKRAKKIFKK